MVEVFALVIYSVQWLGVVLGVGAEVVLLVAHLMALHQHKPEWLGSVPAVRTAQGLGLVLIVASGAGAVGYQFLIGRPDLLVLPVFGFKWALIGALTAGFFLEKNLTRGRALLEGFAGATWLALFLVHSIAPVSPWLDLGIFYGGWLMLFGIVWGAFVLLMKYTGHASAKPSLQKSSPPPIAKPVVKLAPVIVHTPAPVIKPEPVVVHAPAPVIKPVVIPVPIPVKPVPVAMTTPAPAVHPITATMAVIKPVVKKESLWHKLVSFFTKKPKVAPAPVVVLAPPKPVQAPPPPAPKVVVPLPVPPPPPKPAPAPAPVVAAKPANLPAIEPLELMAPHPAAAPVAKAPAGPVYAPDYSNMPGLRVMPQRPEDLHQENRGPLVQSA
jgi:hypothetical protein